LIATNHHTRPRKARLLAHLALGLLAFAVAAGCDSAPPAIDTNLEHPDYRTLADELIGEKPVIITVAELNGIVDSTIVQRAAPAIAELNNALGSLAVLHQIDDTASSPALKSRVNLLAIPFQLLASRSAHWVLAELPPSQRVWLHEFVERRAATAGLPHDVWSVEPAGATELRGVGHRALSHDTMVTPRR
jgi:hypothetical protein